MKQKSRLLACFILTTFTLPAFAGWYEIRNDAGTIGSASVHVSLQTLDHNFRNTPNQWLVLGSYYYDRFRTPISLTGNRQANGEVVLCESDPPQVNEWPSVPEPSAKHPIPCQISLKFSDDGATGLWNDGRKTLPISLRLVGSLDDTGPPRLIGTVEIPMWYHTQNHLLVGIYQSSGNCPVSMLRLRLVNIASGRVDREIPLDCNAGMIMTSIYSNVSRGPTDRQTTVGFQGGTRGYEVVVDIDQPELKQ